MVVVLNKKQITISDDCNLMDLIKELGFPKSVAVFINGKQLLMSQYDGFILSENDEVRIIKPLGGG